MGSLTLRLLRLCIQGGCLKWGPMLHLVGQGQGQEGGVLAFTVLCRLFQGSGALRLAVSTTGCGCLWAGVAA